jgi:hypothetical protein
VLEARPAQVLIRAAPGVLALREDAALYGLFQPGGLVLFQRVQVVQTAQEEQIGDLLDDLERVGDAAGPECVPNAVDLVLDFTSDHFAFSLVRRAPRQTRQWFSSLRDEK